MQPLITLPYRSTMLCYYKIHILNTGIGLCTVSQITRYQLNACIATRRYFSFTFSFSTDRTDTNDRTPRFGRFCQLCRFCQRKCRIKILAPITHAITPVAPSQPVRAGGLPCQRVLVRSNERSRVLPVHSAHRLLLSLY